MENNKLKILIIGGGGREHAIGWKIAQSPRAGQIFFAPGNGGTGDIGTNINIKATDIDGLLGFAEEKGINLTLAIPDDPLSLGIVDIFKKEGLKIFGPTRAAARLESSKAFAKDFMKRHGLPTASYGVFTDFKEAKNYTSGQNLPVVIKASGLALGKGVVICETYEEAYDALNKMLVERIFGDAGSEVVVEEFLTGPEISIHVFSDGKTHKMFPPAQDHKRIRDNDAGPNTGGMGTVSPLPFVTTEIMKDIERSVVIPTLEAMAKEGMPFQGVLFPGLILTSDGPKILEYNARFGDPETETYMRLLESDLLDIVEACAEGTLENTEIKWKKESACTVMLASEGYPGNYEKGKVIRGIKDAEGSKDVVVFHAGTEVDGENIVTSGGRVLGISATGTDLNDALTKAYLAVSKISFEGMQYRKDIGKKALLIK